jgi:hypothetical protein
MLKEKFTATFEFLHVEHQHIELFDFPHSKFRFIAFTFNDKLRELSFDLEKGIYSPYPPSILFSFFLASSSPLSSIFHI